MFVGTGTPRKPAERLEARELRGTQGMPLRQIADRVGVLSPSCMHGRGISSSLQNKFAGTSKAPVVRAIPRRSQRAHGPGQRKTVLGAGNIKTRGASGLVEAIRSTSLDACSTGQRAPRVVTRPRLATRTSTWSASFVTSSPPASQSSPKRSRSASTCTRRTVFNSQRSKDYWLRALQLPRECLRGHTLNHRPTSSSGKKTNKLPYGVCTLRVRRSTWLVQHIYGAIQEYGGFEEPRWLD